MPYTNSTPTVKPDAGKLIVYIFAGGEIKAADRGEDGAYYFSSLLSVVSFDLPVPYCGTRDV